jgi:hypothetical protein
MQFVCTIYGHDYTAGGPRGWLNARPVRLTAPRTVTVSGQTVREAAARAYVRCVGRRRARLLCSRQHAPRRVALQEADPKAIAASLRKTPAPGGACYQLDNLVEAWFIRVEPAPPLRRRHLLRQLRQPLPN